MNIGVIGGGASGMAAAIAAAREGACAVILEGNDRIGKKILATGNGKCNFTNQRMEAACYRSGSGADVSAYLEQFGLKETLDFFDGLGMLYKEKNGYYYPYSEQAGSVLDALRFEIDRLHTIQVLTSKKVTGLDIRRDGVILAAAGDQKYEFDKVILACGSKASPKTGSDGSGYRLLGALPFGLKMIEPVPALVQLRCREAYLKAVSGVRAQARVKLYIGKEFVCAEQGEVQFTDYGISGIPVFQLSRYAAYGILKRHRVTAVLDLIPELSESDFSAFVQRKRARYRNGSMEVLCTGLCNKKLGALFCKLAGFSMDSRASDIPPEDFARFLKYFKHWELSVEGTNGFDMAQICAGGLSMQEVNEHLALKKCPSVYVTGELLDVDGICGGYNLQWAWTSGYIAGRHAGRDTKRRK